jgi:hypothetical protein
VGLGVGVTVVDGADGFEVSTKLRNFCKGVATTRSDAIEQKS